MSNETQNVWLLAAQRNYDEVPIAVFTEKKAAIAARDARQNKDFSWFYVVHRLPLNPVNIMELDPSYGILHSFD